MRLFDVLSMGDPSKRPATPREINAGIIREPKNQVDRMADAAWGQQLQESVMPGVRDIGKYLMAQSPAIEAGMQDQAGNLPAGMLAGIFGGMNSRMFPMSKISDAGNLLSKGKTPEEIRRATGLHKGLADARVRYEIDDSMAELMGIPTETVSQLDTILYHPELFEAYPDIGKIDIFPLETQSISGALGEYQNANTLSGREEIVLYGLNSRTQDEVTDTLMHEIQHAVQQREGFTRGANPGMFDTLYDAQKQHPDEMKQIFGYLDRLKELDPEVDNILRRATERATHDPSWFDLSPEGLGPMAKAYKRELVERGVPSDMLMAHPLFAQKPVVTDFLQYFLNPGETEARDAAARRLLHKSDRRKIPPFNMQK